MAKKNNVLDVKQTNSMTDVKDGVNKVLSNPKNEELATWKNKVLTYLPSNELFAKWVNNQKRFNLVKDLSKDEIISKFEKFQGSKNKKAVNITNTNEVETNKTNDVDKLKKIIKSDIKSFDLKTLNSLGDEIQSIIDSEIKSRKAKEQNKMLEMIANSGLTAEQITEYLNKRKK